MIAISCPWCQKNYRLDSKLAGKKVRCRECEETFPVTDQGDDDDDFVPRAKSTKSATRPVKRRRQTDDENDLFGSGVSSLNALPAPPPKKTAKKNVAKSTGDDSEPQKKPKRKRASYDSNNLGGGAIAAIVSGLVGGFIGALIWAGICYVTHYELGIIAWAVGGLVGICVKAASGDMDESMSGILAGVISVISILAGKLLVAMLIVRWAIALIPADAGKLELSFWEATMRAFQVSFSPIDGVFLLFAVMTAYRIGSGSSSSDE